MNKDLNLKENKKMGRKMDLERLHGKMDLNTQVTLKMILFKVKVSTSGQMEINSRVIGMIIKYKERGYLLIRMVENMKVILKMIKNMVMAQCGGQMEKSILAYGKMENNTVKEY